MFTCNACLRRAFRNLVNDQVPIFPSSSFSRQQTKPLGHNEISTSIRTFRRNHATYESLARGHHKRLLREALQDNTTEVSSSTSLPYGRRRLPLPNSRRKGAIAMTKGEIKDAIARDRNRDNSLTVRDDAEDGKLQLKLKREIENWHTDPLKLANQVRKKLQVPDFRMALNLVRASEGVVMNNVVSWNHLVDFSMLQGDPDKAWKVYNEMKKRGHRPDAHTYTIMLRGLSMNSRNKSSAERAISIYNSMFAPNSNVTPNTIHTNAVLNVCARTRDLDSLWAIAGRLPTSGSGSPDRWTFTTILNAIKEDATAKVTQLLANPDQNATAGLEVHERQERIFEAAMKDARKLWADVSYRWRRTDMMIDETLVCAMGRLILGCGSRKDFTEVFDLVEETMNIRLKERASSIPNDSTPIPEETDVAESAEDKALVIDTVADDVNNNQQISKLPLDESVVYAQPSNNTLGMLMEAAHAGRQYQLGKSYWHVLTTPNGYFKIKADAANIISYLRLLRSSRSSRASLEILSRTWPLPVAEQLYRRGSFVIAMSTCIRDKNSPAVFETADKLVLLMQEKLEEKSMQVYSEEDADADLTFQERRAKRKQALANLDDVTFGEEDARNDLLRARDGVESLNVDPKVLKMYLDLAVITTNGWDEGSKVDGQSVRTERFERNPQKNNTLKALRRIGSHLPIIRRLAKIKIEEHEMATIPASKSISHNRSEPRVKTWGSRSQVGERLEDLIDLLRTIVGAYDKVIQVADRFEDEKVHPKLDEAMIKQFRETKRAVSAFLSQTKGEMAKLKTKRYQFSQFRNRATDEEEEDDDDEEDSTHNVSKKEGWGNFHSSSSPRFSSSASGSYQSSEPSLVSERKITRDIRKVYEDTDLALDRTRSLSRRQRNERKKGVTERMTRRNLAATDIGVLNEDLVPEPRDRVERRMREKVYGS